MTRLYPGPMDADGFWIDHPAHRAFLRADAARQFAFFAASPRRYPDAAPGFHVLDYTGAPLASDLQELHTTTRLVHSYALGIAAGLPGAGEIVDQGMDYLWSHHRDPDHGGYVWGMAGDQVADGRKLAYGHVFVLLAGASAKIAGHPDADRLIADVWQQLDRHFWEDGPGLFADEFNRDWTPFSDYRGMNANMHATEALLTAYEATGDRVYLDRAGRILDFFLTRMAAAEGWRIPEHYHADWQPDRAYAGDPMFRPRGTTPGHSFEFGRLALQWWDLAGRPADGTPARARALIETALAAWQPRGGLAYTLHFDGTVDVPDRYWWPVTEAIGALAALIKLDRRPEDEVWYRRFWAFADAHLIDHARGGWFPELDAEDRPTARQFHGKPDIYHSVQAVLFPLAPGLSRAADGLASDLVPNLAG
ncbi:AGE family epimerase/isomerase [Gemmobacter serpentinus]|uniref:AGE family epimerase/isomerase n=1 Tax=Gemmobacter serpentinus TaxID=2652247 RepID=UPI00124D15B6|nr:AGE family epimerase/isomerase [Gemmobacter serpentinus]